MSVNASNGQHPHDQPMLYEMLFCYVQKSGIISTTAFIVTYILFILPVYIYVLYLGFKQWRQQSAGAAASHSDFLAYQAVFVELTSLLGTILVCAGSHAKHTALAVVGIRLLGVQFTGQLLFQILSCAERYFAVIHPVAYMRQKNSRGIRIRNVVVGFCWLLCFSSISLQSVEGAVANAVIYYALLASSLAAVSFFSFSVLYVLIRPRPAEVAHNRQQVDQQKRKAFKMMTAILSVMLLKLANNLLSTTTYVLITDPAAHCKLWMFTLWTNIPSTLVIPLLYVQRQRKAQCCDHRK